jgi:hypothetical protein
LGRKLPLANTEAQQSLVAKSVTLGPSESGGLVALCDSALSSSGLGGRNNRV